jgi:hypothetical protein
MKLASQALSLLVLAGGIWLAHRLRSGGRDASAPEMAGIVFMTLAGTMAVGTVFSPQFMVWLGAVAAAVACERGSALRVPALAILPIALMTQFVYPFFYARVVAGDLPALVLLASRNFLVLFVAVEAFLALRHRIGRPVPATADPAPAPAA